MKQYIKNEERNILTSVNQNGSTTIIPINDSNIGYQQFLEEQKNGEAELVPYVSPAPTWEQIRAERNYLLTQSDWINMPDAQPKPNKEAWLTYRQALRDVPQNFPTPEAVVWPTKPS